MDRRNLLLTLLLAIPAGLSVWLLLMVLPDRQSDTTERHTPDYYLEEFTATVMTSEGQPQRRLSAERLVHYADNDSTDLLRPHMIFFAPQRPPWQVDAETGWSSANNERVLLGGHVLIHREAAPGLRPVELITRDLMLEPDNDYAETDQPVTVISKGSRVDAVGMRAFLAEERVELRSQVRGTYAVDQP